MTYLTYQYPDQRQRKVQQEFRKLVIVKQSMNNIMSWQVSQMAQFATSEQKTKIKFSMKLAAYFLNLNRLYSILRDFYKRVQCCVELYTFYELYVA